ncbi:MAG: N(G),N(G)-dimethylarginine dimethylaminohydrolase [Proteobacteria bacterium]|nr:N(G),N(G)-dimethylarginine dimethylaminohydrolase [Pseudomonadota bacterium]
MLSRGAALVARSGAPTRRGESRGVESALRQRWNGEIHHLHGPATLDGGDVLSVGQTIFVGLSARTNLAGARALEQCFAPRGCAVHFVEVPREHLHLKCCCSTPAPGTILLAEDTIDPQVFGEHEVWICPAQEAYAANTVGAAGSVLVADGYPRTARLLKDKGLHLIPIDVSEFRKRDGSLSCLSVLF